MTASLQVIQKGSEIEIGSSWSLEGKKLQEEVSRGIVRSAWDLLSRQRASAPILRFRDFYAMLHDQTRLPLDFPQYFKKYEKLGAARVKRNLISKSTNLALISNGAELYISRASDIVLLDKYKNHFTPMPGTSCATKRRQVARDELDKERIVSTLVVEQKLRAQYDIDFLIDSFWTIKWCFIIKSIQEGTFLTFYHRLRFIGIRSPEPKEKKGGKKKTMIEVVN